MSSTQLKITDMIGTKSIPLKTVIQKTTAAPPVPTSALETWLEPNHLVRAIVWPRAQSPS